MKSINFLFENLGTERIVWSMSAEPTWEERESMYEYECTRKYRRLNGERASSADLVFVVCRGYIVGIFKPDR